MKKSGILVLVIAFVTMSFNTPVYLIKNTLKANVTNSTITWKGYKPTGSHTGTIMLQSGSLEVENSQIVGGEFIVDMTTIKDNDGSKKLEGHLMSEDFFEVEAYATSNFKISKSEVLNGKTLITGMLTIKGISKEITFPATVVESNETVTLTSEAFQINRADFNVKYKSKTFFNNLKDKFVEDLFDLQVTIVASK